MKNLYLVSTGFHEGKTMLALGLIHAFSRRYKHIAYMKPLGQPDVETGRHKVDEDSILIERVCRSHSHLKDMSPVTIGHGFPETLLSEGARDQALSHLQSAYERLSKGKNFVVFEGTGNSAVGSVLGLSNATLAGLFNARALILASGGIGHPVDEVILNKTFFASAGVELLGVVMNRVRPHEASSIDKFAKKILQKNGVPLLGTIPFVPELSRPSIMEVLKDLGGELLNGQSRLKETIGNIAVGAMTARNAISFFAGNYLLVTPGDRDDMILAALTYSSLDKGRKKFHLNGFVLTGGLRPSSDILDLIKRTDLPVMLVSEDTYTTASRLHTMRGKISPWDARKTHLAIDLVGKYVHTDEILKGLEA